MKIYKCFMKRFEIGLNLLKLIGDFVLIFVAFLLTYFLRREGFYSFISPVVDFTLYKDFAEFVFWAFRLTVIYVFMLFMASAYKFEKVSLSDEFIAVFKGAIFWFGFLITFYFLNRQFPFSRFVIIFNLFLSLGLLGFGRFLMALLRTFLNKRGYGLKKLLIVNYTSNSSLNGVVTELEKKGEYELVGVVTKDDLGGEGLRNLGHVEDLELIVKSNDFDELLQIGFCGDENINNFLLDYCRYNQKLYSYVPEIFDIQRSNVLVRQIGDFYVYKLENTRLNRWGRVWKRLFDFMVALVALIVLGPVMLIIALLIKLDDPKSTVMWRFLDDGKTIAKRVGYHRQEFYCYKFRTMRPKSHSLRYNELADQDIRKDELVKISNDPRVTKIGKFLRRYDLDELPQLINVLIGNMSLVGPRPHLPEEVARYKDHHQFVFNIKPGITGLSQVNGRSDLSFENEVKLDSYYIENWSLWLDIKILIKTVLVVFQPHGEHKK